MSKIDRLAIYERDQGLCGFCGQPVPRELLHLDHYPVPHAMGGPTVPENLRVAHRRCNIRAGREVSRERRRRGLPPGPMVTIRLPNDLRAELDKVAQEEHRTLTNLIIHALREWLAARGSHDR